MRRSTLVALSTAAALGVVGAASAAPTAPTLSALPPFVRGSSVPITWTQSTFTELSILRSYGLAITSNPAVSETFPGETQLGSTWTPATGFSGPVSITATATETPCDQIAPPGTCKTQATTPQTATSAPVTTTFDNTGPSGGSLSINGGATYTNARGVTLGLVAATDSAGVPTVQVANGASGDIACAASGEPGCPKPISTSLAFTLTDSDGARPVRAIFRDGAVTVPATPLVDGNPSAAVTDSIFLDRKNPTAVPTATPASVQVGKLVTFGSSGSKDDTNGPDDSGIDASAFTWSFGSGASGTGGGASPTRTYITAGTKTVSLTVKDKAGNTGTANVTVTVINPPPAAVVTPPAGGGGVTGGGSTGGGTTGGGTTGGGSAVGAGGGGAAPVPARFVSRLRPVGTIIEGKQMRIALRVRGRVIITVRVLSVRPGGGLGKVVRTFTGLKSGKFAVRFIAPKAGRYRLVARVGNQRRTAPLTVLPAPVVAVEPPPTTPVPPQ